MKPRWKSRTNIFGVALAVLPAVLVFAAGLDWTSFGISPTAAAMIGLMVVILREITTGPVGGRDE
jgi:hypothetical protein